MRILLSGSSGFIGAALAAELRRRGHLVVPITRHRPSVGEVGIDLAQGRLDTSQLPGGTLEGIDASVHLAGTPIVGRWTSTRRAAIRSSRIELGSIIARSLVTLERRPEVHVTGSAIGLYGDRGDEVLDESSAPGSGFLAEVCREWEAAAEPAAAAGIRTAVVRTGIVIGRGGALGPQLPLFRLGLGGPLGSGGQWTSWISLADEVSILCRLLEDRTLSGPFNATAPNPVRNREMAAALGRVLHRPARLSVPAAALRVVLGAGPADEMLLASARVLPHRLEGAGFTFAHPELDGALAAALA